VGRRGLASDSVAKGDHALYAGRPPGDQADRLVGWKATGDERSRRLGPSGGELLEIPQGGGEGIGPRVHRPEQYLVLQHHVSHGAGRVGLDEGLESRYAGQDIDPVDTQDLERFECEMGVSDGLIDQIDIPDQPAAERAMAPSNPTGPTPSTRADRPRPRCSAGASGSSHGGRFRMIQKT
jgi:hypothetical protein